MITKRERIKLAIAGQAIDRPPVSLWRHFPGDDQRSADHAQALVQHQTQYNWDFSVIFPANTYSVADYGVLSEWHGDVYGQHTITSYAVKRSLDWTELRPLDPQRGEIGKQLLTIQLTTAKLDEDVPVLMTLYSPLTQARYIAGQTQLNRDMRTHNDRLHSGLNAITDSTLRLIQALKSSSISGILYIADNAQYDWLSEAEYREFGLPYDLKLLNELDKAWWLNILQLAGDSPMFNIVKDYPIQVVNWSGKRPNLPQGKSLLRGAVSGGISARQDLQLGTPSHVRSIAREAVTITNGRRFILSADGPYAPNTPHSNLRALRTSIEIGG